MKVRFLLDENLSPRLKIAVQRLEPGWQQGGRIWGLLWIRPRTPIGQIAEFLSLIWQTTEAEEWINCVEWIPF
jgi:hypothetical protein